MKQKTRSLLIALALLSLVFIQFWMGFIAIQSKLQSKTVYNYDVSKIREGCCCPPDECNCENHESCNTVETIIDDICIDENFQSENLVTLTELEFEKKKSNKWLNPQQFSELFYYPKKHISFYKQNFNHWLFTSRLERPPQSLS